MQMKFNCNKNCKTSEFYFKLPKSSYSTVLDFGDDEISCISSLKLYSDANEQSSYLQAPRIVRNLQHKVSYKPLLFH